MCTLYENLKPVLAEICYGKSVCKLLFFFSFFLIVYFIAYFIHIVGLRNNNTFFPG